MPSEAPVLSVTERSVTAISLSDTCNRARQVPPDLERRFRYVLLGAGDGALAASIAAAHPHAQVWAWDVHPEHIEATRRRRDAFGLDNLEIWESRTLPDRLEGGRADFVTIRGVLDRVAPDSRPNFLRFASECLRPGGLLCLTYRTTVGWTEIQPVVNFMRYVARNHAGDPADLVPHVLDLLGKLLDGGAAYLTKRPRVAAWVSELFATDHATIEAHYLRDDLHPLSHAQSVALARTIGCTHIGTAHAAEASALSPELAALVRSAPTPVLRETYSDLSVRRLHRADVFRSGVR